MSELNTKQLLKITKDDYFGNVDRKDLSGVLSCMNADATVTIQTDNLTHIGRDTGISSMLAGYFEAFPGMWHGDFDPIIDVVRQAVVLQFKWRLRDREGREDSGENVNIFKIKSGKISEVKIYMSTKDNPLR